MLACISLGQMSLFYIHFTSEVRWASVVKPFLSPNALPMVIIYSFYTFVLSIAITFLYFHIDDILVLTLFHDYVQILCPYNWCSVFPCIHFWWLIITWILIRMNVMNVIKTNTLSISVAYWYTWVTMLTVIKFFC